MRVALFDDRIRLRKVPIDLSAVENPYKSDRVADDGETDAIFFDSHPFMAIAGFGMTGMLILTRRIAHTRHGFRSKTMSPYSRP
jgi:hypothetical protein